MTGDPYTLSAPDLAGPVDWPHRCEAELAEGDRCWLSRGHDGPHRNNVAPLIAQPLKVPNWMEAGRADRRTELPGRRASDLDVGDAIRVGLCWAELGRALETEAELLAGLNACGPKGNRAVEHALDQARGRAHGLAWAVGIFTGRTASEVLEAVLEHRARPG